MLNLSPPEQEGCHFADNKFKCISWMKSTFILIQISLKIVSQGPNDNKPVFIQIMAWLRNGDTPLSKPILTQLTDAYMQH